MVADALSRKEKLTMIISSEELIEEFERLELGVRTCREKGMKACLKSK